jgi:hypothetical protein
LLITCVIGKATPHIHKVEAYQPPKKATVKLAVAEKSTPVVTPPAPAETTPPPSPVVEPVAPPPPAPINNEWHSDCRSQMGAVQEAVNAAGLGDQWVYINYIFGHESCLDPGRVNSIGCVGLGQSCGHADFTCSPSDIACQLAWFNAYSSKYGGWAGSYAFWTTHNYW